MAHIKLKTERSRTGFKRSHAASVTSRAHNRAGAVYGSSTRSPNSWLRFGLSRPVLLAALVAVALVSLFKFIMAAAPNPGHTWSEVGDVEVTVSQGGTGVSSLTANNVILGNGTDSVQFVAPGTSGNILVSNGTTWTSSTGLKTTVLSSDVTQNTNGTYTTIFTINLVQNKINIIEAVLPQESAATGIAIRNRARVNNNAVTGYCGFTTWTSATAAPLDQIAVSTTAGDTGETALLGTNTLSPNRVVCTLNVDNTSGRTLTIDFTPETSTNTVTTRAGAYYTHQVSP